MPLTEVQRRQIEENRRRAQEKRQQQLPPKNLSNQITISNDQFQVTPHNSSIDIRQQNELQKINSIQYRFGLKTLPVFKVICSYIFKAGYT